MMGFKGRVEDGASRERVLRALRHEQPDRVPVDLWGEAWVEPEPESSIKQELLNRFPGHSWNEVLDRLEVDIRTIEPIRPEFRYPAPNLCQNYWGERWMHTSAGWYHTDGALHGASTIQELECFNWPSCDNNDYSVLASQLEEVRGRATLYGFADIWQRASLVIGVDNMFYKMVDQPDFVHFLVNKFTDYYAEDLTRALEATDGKIDIFWMCSDLGTQEGQLISLEMFREFLDQVLRNFSTSLIVLAFPVCTIVAVQFALLSMTSWSWEWTS